MTHEHDWKSTNRYDLHAKIGKQKPVWFVHCSCGENGFTREDSRVIYTWTKDESRWVTA